MGFNDLIKDAFFPKKCFGCFRLGTYLCFSCVSKLKTADRQSCLYCRRASFLGLTHPACQRSLGLSGLISFYYYGPLLKKIIKNIKYRLAREAIDDLLKSIPQKRLDELSFFKKTGGNFCILPVPLHKHREKRRGFNQAYELAKFFSKILDFPIVDDLVLRVKYTKSQTELKSVDERYKNLLGAFSLKKEAKADDIKKNNFIIFDDVWTTGSTIKEVARLLKREGAKKVFALTVAC